MDGNMLLFLVISLALNVVSGITMCQGPHQPPELVKAGASPFYSQLRLQALKVRVELKSGNPVEISWMVFPSGRGPGRQATPENADFRSFADITDDRYVFDLDMKPREGEEDALLSEILAGIYVSLHVNYGCNFADFGTTLDKLIEMTRVQSKLAAISELPNGRYLTNGEGPFQLTSGFIFGPHGKPSKIFVSCYKYLQRKNDNLTVVDMGLSENPPFKSTQKDVLGVAIATTCQAVFSSDLQSIYVSYYVSVMSADAGGVDVEAYHVHMAVELRRTGVTKPVMTVTGWYERKSEWQNGVLTLATRRNSTELACIADAESKPYVALARVRSGNRYEVLPRMTMPDGPSLSLGSARFIVKSPGVSETEKYVCSAARGVDVVSQHFQLKRYDPVTIEDKDERAYVMDPTSSRKYTFTCKATGAPQPRMKFYWTPSSELLYLPPNDYLKANEHHEILDSDYISTTVGVQGNTTIGEVTVDDFKEIIDGLPSNFWSRYNIYVITCYAYNDFSTTSKELGYYENLEPSTPNTNFTDIRGSY